MFLIKGLKKTNNNNSGQKYRKISMESEDFIGEFECGHVYRFHGYQRHLLLYSRLLKWKAAASPEVAEVMEVHLPALYV